MADLWDVFEKIFGESGGNAVAGRPGIYVAAGLLVQDEWVEGELQVAQDRLAWRRVRDLDTTVHFTSEDSVVEEVQDDEAFPRVVLHIRGSDGLAYLAVARDDLSLVADVLPLPV